MSSETVTQNTKKLSPWKRAVFAGIVTLSSLTVCIFAVEFALHWFVKNQLGAGKLYEPDPETGWRTLSNLDLVRRNSDGLSWRIVTDEQGLRNFRPAVGSPSQRLLILGDSLAFGEGVSVEDRFDAFIAEAYPDLSIINTGVPGYGTFQQILRGRPFFDELESGDILLMVTCSNDFMDITRSYFVGRDKPVFLIDENGDLQEELPGITLRGWLRDKSYLASKAIAYFFTYVTYTPEAEQSGIANYEAMIKNYLYPLSDRGVRIVLAYYQYSDHSDENSMLIANTFDGLCLKDGVVCSTVNQVVDRQEGSPHILRDGHWSVEGNARVSDLIIQALEPL